VESKYLDSIKSVMQSEIDKGSIHGSAIRIIHKNNTIYEDELGYADKENGVPMRKDTIYRLYSMSKPVTAVAAMILYERGTLNLLAPVSDYLEGYKNQKVWTEDGLVDVKRPVTVQDLLNMTSGLAYPDTSFEVGCQMEKLYEEVAKKWDQGNPVNTIDLCNMIGRLPLTFHPGEKWLYGTSADVLGAVIEVASGKKYSQFLQDEIFAPLGMVDTGFYVPEEKIKRFAVNYEYMPEKDQLEPCTWSHLGLGNYMAPPAFESGGAGLVSTVEDYSRFALMMANNGTYNNVRILGPKTIAYMTKPQLGEKQMVTFNWDSMYGYNYTHLMRTLTDPVGAASNGTIGEFGWDGWTGNYFFVDPKENLIMIYMIQKCGGGNPSLIRALRSVLYGGIN
jgi:CubicO group peptidase (beta-lactamase class C family)